MKSNWITTTLDEVCSLVTDGAHNSPRSVERGYYMASVKDFTEYGFDFSKCRKISKEDYEKLRRQGCVPQKEDVLVGKDGARYFEDIIIYRQDEQPALLSSIAILRVNRKKITPEFLYYTLKTPAIKKDVRDNYGSGSAIPRIVLKDFKRMPFSYPNIDEQQKITAVCSAIDEKIQVNNVINKNLEQQIEMLLLKTINDADTQPVKLGDYLYIKGRIGWKGLKKSEYLPISNYRIINGESLTLSGIDWNKAGYISAERYEESPEIMLNIGDILLSKDGTIGKIGYVDKLDAPTSVASGIFVIRNTRKAEISTQFIYYLLKSKLFKAFIASRTEGSVIPHLYQKDFMEFEFQLPSPDDMKIFDDTTAAMFSLVFSNLNENERLIHLRDSLLPKLMSGEMDVSALDF